ncbi:MAG TPA: hypothetical protein VGP99_06490, partial [Tepidisphaeraceae bacterium]|nr:hypothetical protein [Tepidisphaeraceae bacterium]
ECGRSFDPHDPQTMIVPGYRKPRIVTRRQSWPPTFGGQIMLTSTMAMLYTIAPAQANCGAWWLGVIGWTAISVAWERRQTVPSDDPERKRLPEGPRWRVFVRIMLLLSIVGSFRFYKCPHATTVWLGPLGGISYSGIGGPCRNDPHHGGKRLSGNWYYAN